jgi:hypothetical protein
MALSRRLTAMSLVSFETGIILFLPKAGAVNVRAAQAANVISLIGIIL